jgi:hypothetical protein
MYARYASQPASKALFGAAFVCAAVRRAHGGKVRVKAPINQNSRKETAKETAKAKERDEGWAETAVCFLAFRAPGMSPLACFV